MSYVALVYAGVIGTAATAKGIQAYSQHRKAVKLARTPRPVYEIPQAQKDALASAKFQASQTELPGQNILQQRLDQGSQGAISNLKDVSSNGSALGSNLASIYRGNVNGQNQLGLANVQNYQNNQAILRGQQGVYSGFQDKQWDINKFQPYENNMAAASALRYASNQNLNSAINDVGSGAGTYMAMKGGGGMGGSTSGSNGYTANTGVTGVQHENVSTGGKNGYNTGNNYSLGSTNVPNYDNSAMQSNPDMDAYVMQYLQQHPELGYNYNQNQRYPISR